MAPTAASKTALRGKKVLVVDDDPALRDALAYIFQRQGAEVHTAGDGQEGFEVAKREDVDLVLTDVRMPRWDGVKLLDSLKERNPHRPAVVMITGFADITIEEAYDKGADGLLQKPFERPMLEEIVIRALLPEEERWADKLLELEADLKIELRFTELGSAVKARLLNIGRGGMLVALPDQLPNINQKIYFNIAFTAGDELLLEGSGVVRWVQLRDSATTPRGCGVEFVSLTDRSRQGVIDLIHRLGTRAFIPRG